MNKKSIWNADLGNGSYKNPILYTDYSDPDAIRVGEDYFMIASSFCNAPGVPVLHSKDLVNWKVVNYVFRQLPEKRYERPIHGCGTWAPAIRYHEGTYFACIPMPDEGIYMSTATDPFGAWSEPVNIRPGAGWIDPCPFWDEDGKAYLVAGVAKSRIGYKSILYIVEMQPDGMGLIGKEVKIFDGNENDQETIEGPKMHKRNGYYYIFAPAGGVKTGWQTVLRSKNVFGPYEYKVVMRQGDTKINGPHQGAWIDTVTGEDWFVHFQDVYGAGRITHLQPMHWEKDWPIIGVAKDGNDYGEPVSEYKKPNVGNVQTEVCEPDTSDDFTGKELGLQWQWNANYKKEWYELSGENLKLWAINHSKDEVYGNMANLLLQKWPAPEFSCVTKMNLSNLCVGDEAGVISMGMRYGALVFAKEESQVRIKYVIGKQNYVKILEETTDEDILSQRVLTMVEEIYVKYEVKRVGIQDLGPSETGYPLERVTISYSLDGKEYLEAGSMYAVPGRWVGVKNGVFCSRKEQDKGGYATIESVMYNYK